MLIVKRGENTSMTENSDQQQPNLTRTYLVATAAVTYDIRKVRERYHRLPPPQVCQSAVDLVHDVFKVVTCTSHFFSHQGSARVCLVDTKSNVDRSG